MAQLCKSLASHWLTALHHHKYSWEDREFLDNVVYPGLAQAVKGLESTIKVGREAHCPKNISFNLKYRFVNAPLSVLWPEVIPEGGGLEEPLPEAGGLAANPIEVRPIEGGVPPGSLPKVSKTTPPPPPQNNAPTVPAPVPSTSAGVSAYKGVCQSLRVRDCVSFWKSINDSAFAVRLIEEGLTLPFSDRQLVLTKCKFSISARHTSPKKALVIREEINLPLAQDVIEAAPQDVKFFGKSCVLYHQAQW